MSQRPRLTPALVRRAEFRVQHAAGLMSIRAALLIDEVGVTDRDIAQWFERGETLRVKGVSSQTPELTQYERLCVRLCELDSTRYAATLIRAGEAMTDILTSPDPRAMGPKVKLISKIIEITAPPPGVEDVRQVGWSQEVMDALTRAELRELDKIREQRAMLAARETAIMAGAKARLEAEARAKDEAARESMH